MANSMKNGLEEAKPWGKSQRTKDKLLQYIDHTTLRLHDSQKGLRQVTMEQRGNRMLSDAAEMQLIQNLCRSMGAKKALDIGVYTGYSALSVALALPADGKVIACDVDHVMPSIGKPFWEQAGVADKIDLRVGPALKTLENLLKNGEAGTFDLAFIDADKVNYDAYYEMSLKLLRKGGIIAVDNALWGGQVADPTFKDEDTKAIDALNRKIGRDERVDTSLLLLGDGTMLAFKR